MDKFFCGTAGCIAFHACASAGIRARHDTQIQIDAENALGLNMDEGDRVFSGAWTEKHLEDVTKSDAIAYLERCLEKGTVYA